MAILKSPNKWHTIYKLRVKYHSNRFLLQNTTGTLRGTLIRNVKGYYPFSCRDSGRENRSAPRYEREGGGFFQLILERLGSLKKLIENLKELNL